MSIHKTFLWSTAIILWACCIAPSNAQQPYDFYSSDTLSGVPVTAEARYDCSFYNRWTGATHPVDYPDRGFWAPPILATHSSGFKLWEEGQLASPGVERYTKTGNTIDLTGEFIGGGGEAREMKTGVPFLAGLDLTEQDLGVIRASQDTPFMTTIARMGPSPDWFSGFSTLDLRQETNDVNMAQQWYRQFQVNTYTLTAGTRSGETYSGERKDLDPKMPIRHLYTETSALSTGVLVDAISERVLPVARWECTLVNAVEVTPDNIDDLTDSGSGVDEMDMESIEPTMDNSAMANVTSMEPTVEFSMEEDSIPIDPEEDLAVTKGPPYLRRNTPGN